MTEQFEVTLRIIPDFDCGRDHLEHVAVAVIDTIDERAADIAEGPAVSCRFDPMSIEIDFGVSAATPADVYEKLAELSRIIADALPDHTSQATETRPVRELAVAG